MDSAAPLSSDCIDLLGVRPAHKDSQWNASALHWRTSRRGLISWDHRAGEDRKRGLDGVAPEGRASLRPQGHPLTMSSHQFIRDTESIQSHEAAQRQRSADRTARREVRCNDTHRGQARQPRRAPSRLGPTAPALLGERLLANASHAFDLRHYLHAS